MLELFFGCLPYYIQTFEIISHMLMHEKNAAFF